ncbi:13799_t:CDS:2 [Ambispora leptoticha]|uniref:13799_t:CDS:1 n=1 Tax=Ambispora leptoticha TaxID=144679 RepID=A0A9N9AD68_9GLOM|nr:13799_t:CDS:2 [Ambispora leptoticha]
MSTSTGKKISLPTINEVEGYKTTEDLINFLRKQDLGLDDKHFNILREQEIKGRSFLRLNVDKLMSYATTASNQEVQKLRERLAILQASKVKEEVAIYFQYLELQTIKLSTDSWADFIQLYAGLKEAFGLKGSLIDYKFVISNKNIDFSWSKKNFVDFIEKHKCSVNNPVRILGLKKDELPAPSTLGIPKEWFKRQRGDPICLNHRPPEASNTIPVSLYNSIFGKFKDFCEEDPEKKDNEFTYKICYEMAKFYGKEEDHQKVANKMLKVYLDHPMELLTIHGAHTDGTVSHSKYREANFEYKCDDCNSDASPYLQNCSYYLVFCKERENSPSFCVTNFPCFLVTIAGPYFSISGAVLADVAIVDPLTPVFPLIWQKHDEMMLSISRAFRALKKSLQILDQYYDQVEKLVQNIPQTDHPVHPSFPDVTISGESYSVKIISQVGNYLLWEVTLFNEQGPKKACVKAVQKHKYSLDTHQLLSEVGYAPKVLASSIIPGNWLLVYIEYLDNHSMLNRVAFNLNDQERNHLREKIEKMVEYLHNLGHVHGDLREGNILVSRLEDNDFDVKLIDFEWSGKAGSAYYSHFMNHKNIQWPDGAEDGKLVTTNHDLFMLKQTFRKTNLL